MSIRRVTTKEGLADRRPPGPDKSVPGIPRGGATNMGRHLIGSRGKQPGGGGVGGEENVVGGRTDLSETVVLRPSINAGGEKKENTYKMSPDTDNKFMAHKVEKLLKDVLDAKLHNVKYDQDDCSRLAREVCCMIKDKTKEFEFSRYKLVTQVLLGQDTDQSVQVASRCLWNHETDDFAAATYRNNSLYAVAIVYGMYLD